MTLSIHTEILIHAPAATIWKILTNFPAYPQWNPFIKSITGLVQAGQNIKVIIQSKPSKQMTFKPLVLKFIENEELSWQGKLLLRGIFDGIHNFELIEHTNGTTTFIQSESFSGLLVPVFASKLKTDTQNGFDAMNKKLKRLAEHE